MKPSTNSTKPAESPKLSPERLAQAKRSGDRFQANVEEMVRRMNEQGKAQLKAQAQKS